MPASSASTSAKTRLPTPSLAPTESLSTQCGYHPSDPARVRLRRLTTCLDNGTFSYQSLSGRIGLIRNLQRDKSARNRFYTRYTNDLAALRRHVHTQRKKRNNKRLYMLTPKEQVRHVTLLLDVPVTVHVDMLRKLADVTRVTRCDPRVPFAGETRPLRVEKAKGRSSVRAQRFSRTVPDGCARYVVEVRTTKAEGMRAVWRVVRGVARAGVVVGVRVVKRLAPMV